MRLVMGYAHAEPHAKAPPEKRLRFEKKSWLAVRAGMTVAWVRIPTARGWQWVACERFELNIPASWPELEEINHNLQDGCDHP